MKGQLYTGGGRKSCFPRDRVHEIKAEIDIGYVACGTKVLSEYYVEQEAVL